MPQHPTPAAQSSPRYRIVFDPPLPSRDGILREHDAAEQRRLKRSMGERILLRLGAEIVVAGIGLLIMILPILSASIALTHLGEGGFAALTGWDVRPPFWIALLLALIWSGLGGVYIAAAFEMFLSALVGIVMLLPILPLCAIVVSLGPLWWVLTVPVLITLGLLGDAHGFGTMIAGVFWVALMVAPVLVARLVGGSHWG
uniref:hypothetical protein n=1 Tax=Paracoccus marcusii TaxID=59779 RepID=UPI00155DB8C3|nr:hypothetical protein [Paracoccus marcusii]